MDERLNKIYKGTSRQIYLELETSAHGLSKDEALKRLETYGHNEIAKKLGGWNNSYYFLFYR